MRAVFFGTPAIAVPALEALAEVGDVVGVVCQPDRPQGRGLQVQEPAVKQRARELGLDVHQPLKVRNGELAEWLRERQADVGLVIAYGRILPEEVLRAPRLGCVNLHASLLPRYRGAAPIQWSILEGDTETGISLMQMDVGCDTGPVFLQERLAIGAAETTGELTERLGVLAAHITRTYLPQLLHGDLVATPQEASLATHAPPIGPELSRLDFSASAERLSQLVRALNPRPGAFTFLGGKRFKLWSCVPAEPSGPLAPGNVAIGGDEVLIGCGEGQAIRVLLGQFEGRKSMAPSELIRGRAISHGMAAENRIIKDG